MNKRELIDRIAETTGEDRHTTQRVVDAVLDQVAHRLADGESVVLPGFGTFEVRHRAARAGRNPQTGEEMAIAASRSPAFKPAAAFKRLLNDR